MTLFSVSRRLACSSRQGRRLFQWSYRLFQAAPIPHLGPSEKFDTIHPGRYRSRSTLVPAGPVFTKATLPILHFQFTTSQCLSKSSWRLWITQSLYLVLDCESPIWQNGNLMTDCCLTFTFISSPRNNQMRWSDCFNQRLKKIEIMEPHPTIVSVTLMKVLWLLAFSFHLGKIVWVPEFSQFIWVINGSPIVLLLIPMKKHQFDFVVDLWFSSEHITAGKIW
jgi:hypothetical protein